MFFQSSLISARYLKSPLVSLIPGFCHLRAPYFIQQNNIAVFRKARATLYAELTILPIGSCINYTPSHGRDAEI